MHKRSSKFTVLFVLISLILAVGVAYAAIVRERTTNITAISGQPDGIEPGGDRHNSYAWAMGTLSQAGDAAVVAVRERSGAAASLCRNRRPNSVARTAPCRWLDL